MKRYFIIFLILATLLTACGNESDQITELWVVTEQSEGEGMSYQAELMAQQFEAEHPGITVRLDILPVGEEGRAAYLQKIRSEVMSGGGPDVYLMPTGAQLPPADEACSTLYMEPLYRDVVMQMYNGIFTDISEYYDADTEISDGLVASIMDAGVMDGARYVLPLRYSYDVLLVDMDAMTEMGVDLSALNGGIDDLYALALETNDELAAHALNIAPSYCLLSDYIDRLAGNLLIDAAEIETLFNGWSAVKELENIEAHQDVMIFTNLGWLVMESGYPGYTCKINSFTNGALRKERFFTYSGYPLMQINISDCIEAAATIKQSGENIAMVPIRAADGSLVAEITYYGAVGSGCRNPKLAYEFLRMFLTEDAQWEQYSTENSLIDIGYPVRTTGFAETVYEKIRENLKKQQESEKRNKYYLHILHREKFIDESFIITDADVMNLTVEVDEGRFPMTTENGEAFEQYLDRLAQSDNVAQEAQNMIDDLQWLITEG